MNTINFDLTRFLITLRTKKRYWLSATVLVILGFNLFGLTLPKMYEAEAWVRINEPKLIDATGTIGRGVLDPRDRQDSIKEEMTTNQFLRAVAHNVNLDAGLDPNGPEMEGLISRMKKNLILVVKDQMFQVKYKAASPEVAYKVVNEIVDRYTNLSGKFYEKSASQITQFIKLQLDEATGQLKLANDAVLAYNQEHIKEIPEEQDNNLRQLHELRSAYALGQQQIQGLENSLAVAKANLSKTPPEIASTTMQQSDDLPVLRKEQRDLQLKLSLMLKDYKEAHWQVKETRQALQTIEARIKEAEESKTETVAKTPNPGYQELQTEIMKIELQLGSLRTQADKQREQMATLLSYLDKMPKVRQEQEKLKSAVDLAHERVAFLSKQMSQAQLTAQMNLKGQGPTYEKMDPPLVPTVPVSPNRSKIGAVSVVLGCGAGFALAFLLSILDTTLRSIEEARRVLQMPILGVVQRVVSATDEIRIRRRRRRRLIGMSTGAALLLLVVAVSLTYYRDTITLGLQNIRMMLGQ